MQLFRRQGLETGFLRKWQGVFAGLLLAIFIFIPHQAKAQVPQSNLNTLYQALSDIGNNTYVPFTNAAPTAAVQTLINDLNGTMPVDEFLQTIMDALAGITEVYDPGYVPPMAGISEPNPANALTTIYTALSGNQASIYRLQLLLPNAFMDPPMDPEPPNPNDPPPSIPVAPATFNTATTLVAWMTAGQGNMGLMTLKMAILNAGGNSVPSNNVLGIISRGGGCEITAAVRDRAGRVLSHSFSGSPSGFQPPFSGYSYGQNFQDILDNEFGGELNPMIAKMLDLTIQTPADPWWNDRTFWSLIGLYGPFENGMTNGPYGGDFGAYTYGCLNPMAREWIKRAGNQLYWGGGYYPPGTPPPPPGDFNDPPDPADTDPPTPPAYDPGTTDPDDDDYDPFIEDEDVTAVDDDLCDYDNSDHPLENDKEWAKNPCTWTRDNQNITWAKDPPDGHQAGWLFANYLAYWWKWQFLPELKNLTAEDNAGINDQTRQKGSNRDVANINKSTKLIQKQELKAKREYEPNEKTCVAGSYTSINSTTKTSSNAISEGLSSELSAAAGNMSGTYDNPSADPPTSEGGSGSGAAGGKNTHNQGTYTRTRLGNYCAHFQDSDANNGDNICPASREDSSKDAEATPMNGDIDIEGFLMKDTLQLAESASKDTAVAMLQNLVYPEVLPEIDETVLDKTIAGQYIQIKEHIEGIKKVAADAISSMLARRAGIPLPEKYIKSVNPGYGLPPSTSGGPAYNANDYEDYTGTPVQESGDYYSWRAKLLAAEGGGKFTSINGYNYLGAYQLGEEALRDINFIKTIPDTSVGDLNQLGKRHIGNNGCGSIALGTIPAPCNGTQAQCINSAPANVIPCNGTQAQCQRSYVLCNSGGSNNPSWQTAGKFRTADKKNPTIFPNGTYALRVFDYEWNSPAEGGCQSATLRTNKDYILSSQPNGCQNEAFMKLMINKWKAIRARGLNAYIGKVVNGILITPSGLLLGSWGGGLRLKQWVTQDPNYVPDAYGTGAGKYIKLGMGHNVNDNDGFDGQSAAVIIIPPTDVPPNYGQAPNPVVLSGAPDSAAAQSQIANIQDPVQPAPGPGQDITITPPPIAEGTGGLSDTPTAEGTVKQMIRSIREKAGIPPGDIADAPSYNEVMKALTKERFLNPEYYATLSADLGALKQEQSGINAYISIQLQDIYKLQEQLNALLAARASMKLNADQYDSLMADVTVRQPTP